MNPEQVHLTPAQAAEWLQSRLEHASIALQTGDQSLALDSYISATGLALQLGPAPAQTSLGQVMDAAKKWADAEEPDALSALGPALVALAGQLRESRTEPFAPVMEAWLAVTTELGALVSHVGLAISLPPAQRAGMLNGAHTRAGLLDDATKQLFGLVPWIERLLEGADAC